MSTPEHPDTPPLTRKQLREIRNTGANPVIDTGALTVATADEPPVTTEETDAAPVPPPPVEVALAPVAHLPRPAEPIVLPEPPGPDRSVDLGVSPLTRRQARQQERIRTASVPVITPDVAAAYATQSATTPAVDPVPPVFPSLADRSLSSGPDDQENPFAVLGVESGPTPVIEEVASGPTPVVDETESGPTPVVDETESGPTPVVDDVESGSAPVIDEVVEAEAIEAEPVEDEPAEAAGEPSADAGEVELVAEAAPARDAVEPGSADAKGEEEHEAPRVVDPGFGAALLAGETPAGETLPPSFDDLIARSSSGSVATPNALILSQPPDGGPIVAPVTATGEVLITGTLNLPEGLGSTGHAPGTADGKEVDTVLVDGELPAHSSPTPIAASAAVSTTKTPGEIIKPPAPEKGGRLMLTLAITAGVLALALVGVLILAFVTGVF
ncbi:hypothetical protein [Microbacterium sp. BK668]|uniref:hypothetical protein n=1 Tax=Microbacterium sp. BK668 TaxID=2512118 RepID=UPI0010E96980|nr:hypothetical protein [Microbacterium sp. BK668]TDN92788.1 hypothetical protein EV279_2320 [Microbacterium sp. BK668]